MNDLDLEARRWLRFSTEDLEVARRLLTGCPPAPRHICWLAQQAAEKALKAALVVEEIDFPFSHDLDALRNLLPDRWSVRTTHPELGELTQWAVETRYPENGRTQRRRMQSAPAYGAVHDSVAAEFKRRYT